MPMGIVSDSDFEAELENLGIKPTTPISKPEIKEAEVIDIKRGRGNTPEIPEIIRETVARSAVNGDATGAEIAKAFNVSPSSVSAYKVGAHSTSSYNEPDESLLSTVIGHRKNIAKGARATLIAALDNITPDKLSGAKAIQLARIAKDMSGIIVDMEPPMPAIQNNQQNVQFVFMAPRVKSEDSYEIREVND